MKDLCEILIKVNNKFLPYQPLPAALELPTQNKMAADYGFWEQRWNEGKLGWHKEDVDEMLTVILPFMYNIDLSILETL